MGLKDYFAKKALEKEERRKTQKLQAKLDLERMKADTKESRKELKALRERDKYERELAKYKRMKYERSGFGRMSKTVKEGAGRFADWAAAKDKSWQKKAQSKKSRKKFIKKGNLIYIVNGKTQSQKKRRRTTTQKSSSDDLFGLGKMF